MSIGVGLIGFGLAGRYLHAPFLGPAGFELRAVATSRDTEVAQAYPSAVVCDTRDLLARSDIDIVVIATPNDTHAELAERALDAGKHVVVDKPMTVEVKDADRLIGVAAKASRILTVYQNRRWDSDFLTVRNLVEKATLGRVVLYESRWDRFRPQVQVRWRESERHGGGLLNDLGPHLVDQALQLLGWPDGVQGDVTIEREGASVDDAFSVRLIYREMRAVLEASSLAVLQRPRFHIHGTEGAYLKSDFDPQEAQLRTGLAPSDADFGLEAGATGQLVDETAARTILPSARGRWLDFWHGLRGAVRNGTPPPVDPAEARDALAILSIARESARTDQRLHPGRPLSVRYRAGGTDV